MKIRRCAVLFIEPREDVAFDLSGLLAGAGGLRRHRRWLAIAPHLDDDIEIDGAERECLGQLSPGCWRDTDDLPPESRAALGRLLDTGLVLDEQRESMSPHFSTRDEAVRAVHWWPLAAISHYRSRWKRVDGARALEEAGMETAEGLRSRFGPPPPAVAERVAPPARLPLTRAGPNDFDKLLSRRTTCRNFDTARCLPESTFAHMLQRVFGAEVQVRVDGDTMFLKKTSPSGGGLHATGAYLIVQNVEGVEPGLYHYHPVDHALEPLPPPELPLGEFAQLALAGQHWFANAPALVVLTPRFARSFWKYRHHAKAYRALILDSGHLSQTLYLSATELGLGAFVTSAINEIDIEQAFGMDPLEESPLAICGFGWRAERMETAEFDPGGEVWEAEG